MLPGTAKLIFRIAAASGGLSTGTTVPIMKSIDMRCSLKKVVFIIREGSHYPAHVLFRLLGVNISANLPWAKHIDVITKMACQTPLPPVSSARRYRSLVAQLLFQEQLLPYNHQVFELTYITLVF